MIARGKELAASLHPAVFRLTREYLRGDRAEKLLAGLEDDAATFAIVDG